MRISKKEGGQTSRSLKETQASTERDAERVRGAAGDSEGAGAPSQGPREKRLALGCGRPSVGGEAEARAQGALSAHLRPPLPMGAGLPPAFRG